MQEKSKRYQCRHIFTDGHRCGSPCLRHEELCYYHHTTRRPIDDPAQRRGRQAQFDLPLPEDRGAIQCAIGEVILRIARNQIDPKRAGLLLYGLQIASINLPRKADRDRDSFPVEEVTTDPQLGTLAPRIEVGKATIPEERLSVVARLLRDTAPLLDDEANAPRPASGTWDSTKTSTEPASTDAPTPALEHPAEAPQDQTTEVLPTLHASEAPGDDGKQHKMLIIPSTEFSDWERKMVRASREYPTLHGETVKDGAPEFVAGLEKTFPTPLLSACLSRLFICR